MPLNQMPEQEKNNTRILLIENEAIIALEMKRILQKQGIKKENITHLFRKSVVEDLIEQHGVNNLPFDLILTDKDVLGGTTDSIVKALKPSGIPLASISGETDQSEEYGLLYIGKDLTKKTAHELIQAFHKHAQENSKSIQENQEEIN